VEIIASPATLLRFWVTKDNNIKFKALVAAALAWLVPGMGHIFIGQRVRGLIILVVIAATFWAGIGMGGVMTVDREAEPMWFIAEMLTGTHGLVTWRWQQSVMSDVNEEVGQTLVTSEDDFNRHQWYRDARDMVLARRGLALVAPVDVIARVYSGVAGMLNLLCIFDALMLVLINSKARGVGA